MGEVPTLNMSQGSESYGWLALVCWYGVFSIRYAVNGGEVVGFCGVGVYSQSLRVGSKSGGRGSWLTKCWYFL